MSLALLRLLLNEQGSNVVLRISAVSWQLKADLTLHITKLNNYLLVCVVSLRNVTVLHISVENIATPLDRLNTAFLFTYLICQHVVVSNITNILSHLSQTNVTDVSHIFLLYFFGGSTLIHHRKKYFTSIP